MSNIWREYFCFINLARLALWEDLSNFLLQISPSQTRILKYQSGLTLKMSLFSGNHFVSNVLSKLCLEWSSGDFGVTLNDLEGFLGFQRWLWMTFIIFTFTLTLKQEPYENIKHTKIICRFFLKVLEHCKLYSAYSILNFECAFLELIKLFKRIFFKRKIKFVFLPIFTKFSVQIANIIWEPNL